MILPNGRWCVNQDPVPRDLGRDEDPPGGPAGPDDAPEPGLPRWQLPSPGTDPTDDPQVREAYLDSLADDEYPGDPDEEEDPDNAPPPGLDDAQLAALIAEAREVAGDQARADALFARLGQTAAMAAVAAGNGDRYAGATDDEVLNAICAWDRVEAHASARKHAAEAELIRRRPARGCGLEGPTQMPAAWDEFTCAELAPALGQSRGAAEDQLGLAWDLEVKLPGTRAAFWAGIVTAEKAEIIAAATAVLDPAEAWDAEALVLDRAGWLTPGGLRSAIARAVMEVAPEKAKKRREQAARDARVERWAEESGNAALAGRELPPAQVLAADGAHVISDHTMNHPDLLGHSTAMQRGQINGVIAETEGIKLNNPVTLMHDQGNRNSGHGGGVADNHPILPVPRFQVRGSVMSKRIRMILAVVAFVLVCAGIAAAIINADPPASSVAPKAPAPTPSPSPVPASSNFKLAWSTNFPVAAALGTFNANGVSSNATIASQWSSYPTTYPDTAMQEGLKVGGYYDPPTTVSISGGQMHIKMWRGPSGNVHSCAMIPKAAEGKLYGEYVETFRVSKITPGYKSAHLLWPTGGDRNYEVDYPEGNWNEDFSAFVHSTHQSDQLYFAGGTWGQWHTTITQWAPNSLKFYLDGKLIGQASGNWVPNEKMDWIIQNESTLDGTFAALNSSAQIDLSYVAYYSYVANPTLAPAPAPTLTSLGENTELTGAQATAWTDGALKA
jgi:Domain of unknown function (DUF222)